MSKTKDHDAHMFMFERFIYCDVYFVGIYVDLDICVQILQIKTCYAVRTRWQDYPKSIGWARPEYYARRTAELSVCIMHTHTDVLDLVRILFYNMIFLT